jgi:hypothetical protein
MQTILQISENSHQQFFHLLFSVSEQHIVKKENKTQRNENRIRNKAARERARKSFRSQLNVYN